MLRAAPICELMTRTPRLFRRIAFVTQDGYLTELSSWVTNGFALNGIATPTPFLVLRSS